MVTILITSAIAGGIAGFAVVKLRKLSRVLRAAWRNR